jgi:HK97 family phage major capsid protein
MLTEIDKRLAALAEDKDGLNVELNELLALEEDFDDEAQARADEIQKEIAKIDKKIALNESLKEDAAASPRPKPANKPKAQEPISLKPAWQDDEKLGYKHERDFFADVIAAGQGKRLEGDSAQKLNFLATAGSDEHMGSNDAYGGYLVPEGFLAQLYSVGPEMDPIGSRVTNVPMANPTVKIPARTDKNHTSSVSGGLTVARRHETQSPTSSRMQFETVTLQANTLMGLTYATEEIMSDSAISLAAIIQAGFRDQFVAAKIKERIRGTGVGEFEGILNCPATISVTRETTDTITDQDVLAMRQRAWNYGNSIWIANHDTLTTLMSVHIPLPASTPADTVPLFVPGNGTDKPDTLLGRPIVFSEYASTLANTGDLILADWSQYLEGTYQGLQNASSMHVRFLNHEQTFKFWERCDGRSWWRSPLTPEQSSETLSPFVVISTDT